MITQTRSLLWYRNHELWASSGLGVITYFSGSFMRRSPRFLSNSFVTTALGESLSKQCELANRQILPVIPSRSEKRTFVQEPHENWASNIHDKIEDEHSSRNPKSTMFGREVATSVIRGRLREMQRVCEDSRKAVLTAIVKVSNMAWEGV